MISNMVAKLANKLAICRKTKIDFDALKKRLNVENWVAEDYQYQMENADSGERSKKKITVGLLHCEETSYNMVHSLYYAFKDDRGGGFNPIVILQGKGYKNHYKELEMQMRKQGLQYDFDYNCADTKFDILIVHHVQLPPTEDINKIICNATLKIAVPIGVVSYGGGVLNADNVGQYQVSDIFVEQSIYNTLSQKMLDDFRCYATGNPKFDYIYDAYLHKVNVPDNFIKLKNPCIKKIILWTTDHNGNFRFCSPDVAFDLYADLIFKYIRSHKDVGLIFRPYRIYVQELMRDGLWTLEQVDYFKQYCKVSENIVWDDEPDYSVSYSMADAILADAGCGIICSALPMMKPIGLTLRWDMNMDKIMSSNQEICDNHYLISSEDEMLSFIEMVKEERDPNAEKRARLCEKYVTNFDGKNGERIKNILKDRYQEICG